MYFSKIFNYVGVVEMILDNNSIIIVTRNRNYLHHTCSLLIIKHFSQSNDDEHYVTSKMEIC